MRADGVGVVEVVSQVEFAEPQGHGEAGLVGGEVGGAMEGNGEVGPVCGRVC